jgi:hypothetical protein
MNGKLSKARKQGNLLAYLLVPHMQLLRLQPLSLEVQHQPSHLQVVSVPLFTTSPSSIRGKNQLEQSHAGKSLM